MKAPKSILVVIERAANVSRLMDKALRLARSLGARLELYLCDSEQAYVLAHAYDRAEVRAARATSIAEARHYLSELRKSAEANDVEIAIDAECASPLYETVVYKVLRSTPDMVIKATAATDAKRHGRPDPNDWELMRTCPVTLILAGEQVWRDPPRVAAAVDVSEGERAEISRTVLEAAVILARAWRAQLHLVYGEAAPAESAAAARLEKLHGLCGEAGIAPERARVLAGQPERTLPVFIREQGYDALVLGALSHRAMGTTAVGTLTSALLDALECDFVLVKSPTYRSPIATGAR